MPDNTNSELPLKEGDTWVDSIGICVGPLEHCQEPECMRWYDSFYDIKTGKCIRYPFGSDLYSNLKVLKSRQEPKTQSCLEEWQKEAENYKNTITFLLQRVEELEKLITAYSKDRVKKKKQIKLLEHHVENLSAGD